MSDRYTIAVLKGGRSGEHDVSLESAKAIEAALEARGHTVWRLTFGRAGGALWPDTTQPSGWATGTFAQALLALETAGVDGAFIAMHGSDGEDGRIQAALELCGIRYQGSGVVASAVALDKARSKVVYRSVGLPVADDVVILGDGHGPAPDWDAIAATIGLPCVLKTAQSGSSVGVEIVDSVEQLSRRGQAMLLETESLMVERFVRGREFTVAILEGDDGVPAALAPVEIRPVTARFFDYEAKYTPGATDEICPADISSELAHQLQSLALRAHRAMGCRHYSRTDFMTDSDLSPVVLETNTLPGLTPVSLFPKAAVAAGLPFEALVQRLVARTLGVASD